MNISEFLRSRRSEFTWLLKAPLTIDNGCKILLRPGISAISDLQEYIQKETIKAGKVFAFGGYLEDQVFFLLFGHLSRGSLVNLEKGKFLKKGEKIANLGTFEENAGWPPHLHFQIIKDMEEFNGDYPGVAKKSELDHYRNNCPDPMIIFI